MFLWKLEYEKLKPELIVLSHRISEAKKFNTVMDILTEITLNLGISVRTVRRRLNEFGLKERIARNLDFEKSIELELLLQKSTWIEHKNNDPK